MSNTEIGVRGFIAITPEEYKAKLPRRDLLKTIKKQFDTRTRYTT
jgi:hypothetical protein